jgi:hypothetical protein
MRSIGRLHAAEPIRERDECDARKAGKEYPVPLQISTGKGVRYARSTPRPI